jgi:hypothetical protein
MDRDEGKVEYWKQRMLDKAGQFERGYRFHFKQLLEWGAHSKLEPESIEKAVAKVERSLAELRAAIRTAKVKSEEAKP